jgi:nucleoside-diphosphate-sugar epimerase
MKDLFSLQGRTALVTGGSRGIGRMIATGLLSQGARVYISSRKADACDRAFRCRPMCPPSPGRKDWLPLSQPGSRRWTSS